MALNSCVSSSYSRFPTDSFVKVHTKMTVQICTDQEGEDVSKCYKENFYSVGSGSVIGHKQSKTIFLTAAHVCHAEVQDRLKPAVASVLMEFKVQNTKTNFMM